MLTAQRLRELLSYDPKTGEFTRRGARAGTLRPDGRRQLAVDGKIYLEHRLAWLYMTGAFPTYGVDHRDGDPSNNRWKNLREATPAQNNQNLDARHGLRGVTKFRGKWQAQINVDHKFVYLGLFDSPELAHEAYLAAKAKLHTFQPTPRLCTKV